MNNYLIKNKRGAFMLWSYYKNDPDEVYEIIFNKYGIEYATELSIEYAKLLIYIKINTLDINKVKIEIKNIIQSSAWYNILYKQYIT